MAPSSSPRTLLPALLGALALSLALSLALPAATAEAQRGPASALGNPRTGEPGRAVPPAPNAGTQGARTQGAGAQGETDAGELSVPPPPGGGSGVLSADLRNPTPGLNDGLRVPSPITTRLRALEGNLRSLGGAGAGSILNAILSVAGGALSITLGALIDVGEIPVGDPSIAPYLYTYGSAAVIRGILDPILTPDASGPSTEMTNMPMTSLDEVYARLHYGENALSSLAERGLISRILDGSINIAAGLAVIPIYLGPKDFVVNDAMDYFVLIASGISVISGAVTLFSPSGAEQRWDAYQRLRDRVSPEEREAREAGGREVGDREAGAREAGDREAGDAESAAFEAEEAEAEARAAAAAPGVAWRLSPTMGGAYTGLSGHF